MEKKTKSLIIYVLIAYLFTWGFWLVALWLGYEDMSFMSLINWEFKDDQKILPFFLFRIAVYGPLIGGFTAAVLFSGKEGVRELISRIFKWKISPKWYILIFVFPVGLNFLVVIIGLVLGIPFSDFFQSRIPLTWIVFYFLYELLTSGLEEPGWRGFAIERLQERFTAENTSWILGLIWAVWHYPYVIFLYYQAGPAVTVMSLTGFTMAIIGQTFIITWFYNHTRSVLIAVLLHASLNTTTTLILGNIPIEYPQMGIIPALVTWGIVFILLKIYGGETLTGKKKTDTGS